MGTLPQVQKCNKCGIWKSIDEFYLDRGKPKKQCKRCVIEATSKRQRASEERKAYEQKYRAEHRKEMREYLRAYKPQWRAKRRKQQPGSSQRAMCRLCNQWKPLEAFSKDKTKLDGIRSDCKACVAARYDPDARRQAYTDNRDYISDRDRRYRARTKHAKRAYRLRNKIRIRFRNEVRRARMLQSQGTYTLQEWTAMCEWFGNRCLMCGENETTVDHVIPIVAGGANTIQNLQPLCGACNSSKGTKDTDYRDPQQLAAFLQSLGNSDA